jgi:nicotinamidase-related amidase
VQRAAEVIKNARSKGGPVIHVRHESPEGEPFFVAGSPGAEIIPAVAPDEGEQVVVKNYPNAFRDTDLKARLEAEGVNDVIIVGAMTHMCIDATARAAADQGYNVTIVEDATATRDAEFNGMTVRADLRPRVVSRDQLLLWQSRGHVSTVSVLNGITAPCRPPNARSLVAPKHR